MPGPMGGGPGPGGRSGTSDRAENFGKTTKRLIAEFKPLLAKFILVSIIVVIGAVLTIISPIFIKNIIQNFTDFVTIGAVVEVKWDVLFFKFGLVMGFYTVSALLSWLADWIVVKISANYAHNLRRDVERKLNRLPLSFFDKQTYGEILSRGTNDVDTISRSMQQIITQTVSGFALLIGVLIAMFVTDWRLALVVLATLPLSVFLTVFIAMKSQKEFIKFQQKLGRLNSHVEENYSGYKIVKLFNKEEESTKAFQVINKDMAKADRMSQFLSGIIFPMLRFVNNLGFVGVSVVGGLLSSNSPGEALSNMVAFFMFISIFQQPFQQIGQISNIIQSTVAAAERIFNLLDEKEVVPDDVNAITNNDAIVGKVDFDHVDFSYTPEVPLIEDMNLHVNPGDSIAIVGPTGAGKTTIVNLIMRFYELNSGSIKLDGIDIKHYSREALRGSIGMVLQDTWLFSGSIKDNIRYGREDATDEEIVEAAKSAHAHHFISTLPNGYDFVLNEDGTNISQGQRQLLTIARAIISRPKILILDEATSSVDTRTEVAIQEAMGRLMENRTSFVIAHRLSTIKNAKMIIVMNKGKIIETGNHKELLEKKGFYADLYNAQFSGTNPLAPKENE
jgi:ATP-binding cassette, subfamily B, multidrug efflux pump